MKSRFIIPTEILKGLLEAASKDTTRPHICGVAVDLDEGIVFATDGHRGVVRVLPKNMPEPPPIQEIKQPPTAYEAKFKLDKKSGLYEVLNKLKKEMQIVLTFQDGPNPTVSVQNSDRSITMSVPLAEYESYVDGGAREFGVNPKYLISALTRILQRPSSLSDPLVKLQFGANSLDPLFVRGSLDHEGDYEIVMPSRL